MLRLARKFWTARRRIPATIVAPMTMPRPLRIPTPMCSDAV